MYTLTQDDLALNFSIVRSKQRRKTISIEINRQKQVALKAPLYASHEQILKLLKQRWQWIFAKLAEIEAMPLVAEQTPWYQAAQIFYLGQAYPVHVESLPMTKIRGQCEFSGSVFMLSLSQGLLAAHFEKLRIETLTAWYFARAKALLVERTQYFAERMQVMPQKIIVKTQKRRWGSCDSANNIRYNWKVIMAAPELIDYLVVHELAHIRFKNHSKDFWGFVASVLPDYQNRRKKLREFGQLII